MGRRNYKGKGSGKPTDPREANDKYEKYVDKARAAKNDASWYTRNSQLALDAGRFSFTWPTGAPFDLTQDPNVKLYSQADGKMKVPGVIRLGFVPTYGRAKSGNDPLNVASFNIYGWVRHANSGHTNYDAPDLMLYLMAMDSIYMFYQFMVRTYGLLETYAQRNRHLPTTVFAAMHVDYRDMLMHMADLRKFINVCAVKIGSLCVPSTMPLYTRHMWMCSGLYADSPSVKSQFYVFCPEVLGKYNERTSSTGGYLEVVTLPASMNFNDFVTHMDDLISAVVASEDCNIMSGDIKKAFGEGNLFQLAMIGDSYTVEPTYTDEVLRQIQNATCVQKIVFNNARIIDQDVNNGILTSGYDITFDNPIVKGKRIITGSSEDPSPEEVLVNTRLVITANDWVETPTGASTVEWTSADPTVGTEVVVEPELWENENTSFIFSYVFNSTGTGTNLPTTLSVTRVNQLAKMNFWNYHPMIMWGRTRIDSSSGTAICAEAAATPFFDVDNYAVMDDHDIDGLHNTAVLSLLDVPQLGRVSG